MKISSSYHQQRLWFIDYFEKDYLYEGSPIYHNVPLFIKIDKAVTEDELKDAFETLVTRHEVLRTSLMNKNGKIFQIIADVSEFNFEAISSSEKNVADNSENLRQLPLDFHRLMKVYYEIDANSTSVLVVIHHAIVDRHSIKVIRKELLELLTRENELVNTPIAYQNFSNWQNSLTDDNMESLSFYWKSKLRDLQVLYLPTDRERDKIHVYASKSEQFRFPKAELSLFCEKQGLTPRGLFLSAYKMALSRFSGLSDIVLGTFMNPREAKSEYLLGPLENLVILRSQLDVEKSLLKNAVLIEDTWNEAARYKTMPFDKLVSEINPKKDMSRTALFDVLYAFESYEEGSNEPKSNNEGWGKYDFNLYVKEQEDHFDLILTYNKLYFNSKTIQSVNGLIERILEGTIESGHQQLMNVELVSSEEKEQLINLNDSRFLSNNTTIVDWLGEQVDKNNNKPALSWDGGEYTYQEIDEKSNKLANVLVEKLSVQVEDKVAVLLTSQEQIVITLLAVLKAGGAYVPINPAYPEVRKSFIMEDANCEVRIDEQFFTQWDVSIDVASNIAPNISITAENLAYIIYTSGTTGQPKGVLIEHGNVISLLKSCFQQLQITAKDNWLFFHSYCFDFSVWEIFGCFLSGGNLFMVDDDKAKNARDLSNLMNVFGTTVFSQTPSAFYNFIEVGEVVPSLRYVVFGGEALNPLKLKSWSEENPNVELVNMYGITETTVHVTIKKLDRTDIQKDISNIGKPLSFAKCFILNKEQQLVPYGLPGELYISGSGVARGYLNRPELNEERFLKTNTFGINQVLYKTGDLARFLENGDIQYLGRVDDQVKIRGYRIELDEINRQLQTLDGVKQSTVKIYQHEDGDKSIVAYASGAGQLTEDVIRFYLASKLPAYMVPTFIVVLDNIPLNSNGKIEKASLPSPLESINATENEIVAPTNSLECDLFAIWKDILGIENFGITHNFFEIGGHSLKATRLMASVQKQFYVKIGLKDIFENPSIKEQARFIKGQEILIFTEIPKVEEKEYYPISSAQRRLWVQSQLEGGSIAYNMPSQIELSGTYHIENFAKAVNAVVDRHEILRTVFTTNEEGNIQQKVLSKEELDFEIVYEDFRSEKNAMKSCEGYINNDSNKAFDLENGPLIRASLLQFADEGFVFYYNMHHIISDGWSMEILSRDIMSFYNAFHNEIEANLPGLRIQYKDYASWQLNESKSEEYQTHKTYWLNEMKEEIPLIDLPSNKQRPSVKTYNGANVRSYVNAELTQSIQGLIKENGGSLFTYLLAAWNVMLHKYTSLEDLVMGSPVSGRSHSDLNDQIGFYVNTLALRNKIDPNESFLSFYEKLHQHTLESFEHQTYSFDALVEDLDLQVDPSRNPLFDIIFTVQSKGQVSFEEIEQTQNTNDITISEGKTSKFDMQVIFEEEGDSIAFHLGYNTDTYEKEMIVSLVGHFKQLLTAIVKSPEDKINELNYLLDEEVEQLTNLFNNTKTNYPDNKSIVDLFQEQAQASPAAIALECGELSYSYKELDELSNQLANYLITEYGIISEDLVGIMLPRNEWHIISLLGIIKTGGAYVPFDADFPEDRIVFMKDDCNCKVIVNQEVLNDFIAKETSYSIENPQLIIGPENLAYIVYTSGSTGTPKGVMIEHKSVVRLVKSSNYFEFKSNDVILASGSFSFDATTFEFFGPLLNGAKLVITSKEVMMDPKLFKAELEARKVTAMWFTSGWLNQLVDTSIELFETIKFIVVGGDRLSPIHIEKLISAHSDLSVYNVYGPTENTTFSSYYPINEVVGDIPIGKPISNTTAYILNKSLHLVPVGVTGEIYLGGDGLFRGYLNQRELTAAKFITHPFVEGERLYKTGDLGFWLPDGNIKFVGRVDNQVKINGHRIELGEIEYQLQNKESINEVVVLINEVEGKEKQITAYFISEVEENHTEVRSFLSSKLPDYMLPNTFMQLDEMPLNSNGKVDKKALLSMNIGTQLVGNNYEAPTNEMEEQLTVVWGTILKRVLIGITDDFFDLGGNSLKLLTLINELHKKFEYKITMKEIFSYRTIKEQAVLIENAQKSTYLEIEKADESESYPVSVTQKRLLLLSHMAESSVAYNMPTSMVLKYLKDINKFIQAVYLAIDRHEILRTVFKEDQEGNYRQWVLEREDLDFNIQIQDFRNHTEKEQEVNDYIARDSGRKFDLRNGPLLRASLLQVADNDYIFYYNMHHIVGDGWSIEVLSKDVMAFYEALLDNRKPNLPALRIQYKDFAIWQLNRFKNNELDISKLYWFNQFAGDVPQLDLTFSKTRPKIKTFNGNLLTQKITGETLKGLTNLCTRTESTLFMNLMCMFGMVLNRYSYQNEFIVGSPMVARVNVELKNQIGFYVNTLIYKLNVKKSQSYLDMLSHFKDRVLENFEYREYPFDLLVEDLNKGKDFSRNPLFDAMLVINENDQSGQINSEASTGVKVKNQNIKSKFDITFTFNVYRDEINCNVIYNSDLFERANIDEMLADYMSLMNHVISDDSLFVKDYVDSMIKEEELQEHDTFFSEMLKTMENDF